MVVVVDVNKDNPLIGEVRRLGVRVVVGDATNAETLRVVVFRNRFLPPRRVSLRRLYAVTWHQHTNLTTLAVAKELLNTYKPPHDRPEDAHVDNVIPRLFVKMDNTREARQWRLEQLEGMEGRFFADAITPVGIAASFVAGKILPDSEWLPEADSLTHALLVGESTLALALLDELAWQQWARYEVALSECERVLGDEEASSDQREQAQRQLAAASEPALCRVSLLGNNAKIRTKEWTETRAPWSTPREASPANLRLFDVEGESCPERIDWARAENEWEVVADEALANPLEKAVVIFVDAGDAYEAAAMRLARRYPGEAQRPRVLLRVDETASWHTSVTEGGVQRFVPSLVEPSEKGDTAPADSVIRFAAQQHTVYRGAWPKGEHDRSPRRQRNRVTNVDWPDLPCFFQEDNMRQHWQVLNWFAQAPEWEWKHFSKVDVDPATMGSLWAAIQAVVPNVAKDESERWNKLRKQHGWWCVSDAKYRNDPRRLTNLLTPWPEGGKASDIELIRLMLRRMWATGLAPVSVGAFPAQRVGQHPEGPPTDRRRRRPGRIRRTRRRVRVRAVRRNRRTARTMTTRP